MKINQTQTNYLLIPQPSHNTNLLFSLLSPMFITFVERIFLVDPFAVSSTLDPIVALQIVLPFFSILDNVFFVSSITICFLEAILFIELIVLSYFMNNVPFCGKNSMET